MALKIPVELYDQLRQHGEATYPHECCGVLVGEFDEVAEKLSKLRCNAETRAPIRWPIAITSVRRSWCAFSGMRCWQATTLSASTTLIPIIQRTGRQPILPRRIGQDAPMS